MQLSAAGGLADKADTKHINFAQLLEDEMYIYIPLEGEDPAGHDGLKELTSKEAKVNINRADESELLKLTGIGPSKASAVIKYREENGPFEAIEDIMNVSGIGEKTLKEYMSLSRSIKCSTISIV
ncbi:MAG: helix-hairpin-helix domain-containing protein [Alkalibacterium sp.]|nr:helix-hairpin-helix domain-containing protein [Alkalibacterium sp.]